MPSRTVARQRGASSSGSPTAAEVAGEDAAAAELLRGEVELRRNDERLEQALGHRLAEEEMSHPRARSASRQPSGPSSWLASTPVATTTASAALGRTGRTPPSRLPVGVTASTSAIRTSTCRAIGLDRGLRLVEVAVVLHTRRLPRQLLHARPGNELGGLGGRDDPRCDPLRVLHRDVSDQARESVLAVRDEEIAASPEAERNRARQPLLGLAATTRPTPGPAGMRSSSPTADGRRQAEPRTGPTRRHSAPGRRHRGHAPAARARSRRR